MTPEHESIRVGEPCQPFRWGLAHVTQVIAPMFRAPMFRAREVVGERILREGLFPVRDYFLDSDGVWRVPGTWPASEIKDVEDE